MNALFISSNTLYFESPTHLDSHTVYFDFLTLDDWEFSIRFEFGIAKMARTSFGLSNRLSIRTRRTKAEIDEEKGASTELNNVYPSEKGERLTARFGFAEPPEYSMASILDSPVNCDERRNPFKDGASSTTPTLNEQAWEALVSGSSAPRSSRTHGHVRKSSLSSIRMSRTSSTSKRRSLCDWMCEAASTGDVPQVGRLLGAGADPKKKSKEGLLPVHLAAAGGHLGVLKSLAMHGAKMDATDGNGRTALHAAVLGRQADVIPFLIQSGVPVDAKDVDGCTALQLAGQMDAKEGPEELDLETAQNSKVRFSYVFGASKAAKRVSMCSTSSMSSAPLETPLEALLKAGASAGDMRSESRL